MRAATFEAHESRPSGKRTLVDTTQLMALRDILSPRDLRKLIGDVIGVVQHCTRAIRSTRGRPTEDTLCNAYNLYGTAASFGLMPLASAAERVVSTAKAGQGPQLSAHARELVTVGETTVEALLVWIDQTAPDKAA